MVKLARVFLAFALLAAPAFGQGGVLRMIARKRGT